MAAYAATVTLDPFIKTSEAFGTRSRIGYLSGKVDVTNYNQTLAEITAITSRFQGDPNVIITAGSDNGFLCRWDAMGKAIKAYTFDYDAVADGAAIQAANDTDIGVVEFLAVGVVR